MVPVITAIVAALFAGAVALFREQRLELRRFLVATRVVGAVLQEGSKSMSILSFPDFDWEWSVVDGVAASLNVPDIWHQHRDVLASHLSRQEWHLVATAIATSVRVLASVERRKTPADLHALFESCMDEMHAAALILSAYCARAGMLRNPGHKVHLDLSRWTQGREAESEERPSCLRSS
jgi:hypothetical protein